MSDGRPMEEIQIEIIPQRQDIVDDTKRRDVLLRGREIIRLGEQDSRFRDVVFLEEALEEMISFGMSNRAVEVAGALFGFHCGAQTIITQFLGSSLAEGTAGTINFTPGVWADLHKRNDLINRNNKTDDELLAWFHTHPRDFPPSPITLADKRVMSGFFANSDKNSPSDRSTIIMTTYTGDPSGVIAVWKWSATQESAILQKGIGLAVKDKRSMPQINYYMPPEETARIIKTEVPSIVIDFDDLDGEKGVAERKGDDISIVQNPDDGIITISLTDGTEGVIKISLEDLSPELETIKISLDDITPEKAKVFIRYLNRNPDGRGSKIIRNILRAVRSVLPSDLRADVDLVLEQTRSVEERIKIIS